MIMSIIEHFLKTILIRVKFVSSILLRPIISFVFLVLLLQTIRLPDSVT